MGNTGRPLRIAIECRIPNTRQGHGTAIAVLAHALSMLKESNQEYFFLVSQDAQGWLESYVSGSCRIVAVPRAKERHNEWKKVIAKFPLLDRVLHKLPRPLPDIPVSDGFAEREGFDAVHFPTQMAYLTRLPSLYQPWDLQHVHLPQFFSERDLAIRNRDYRAFCTQAQKVCVQAEWTKADLIASYEVAADKIRVIPWSIFTKRSGTVSAESLASTKVRYELPDTFFFYPAVTWPHKNHAVVFRALELLRSRHGISVPIFLSGSVTPFWNELNRLARELKVQDLVRRLGYVPSEDLQSIYALGSGMIFPSMFEGFGLPVLEAFQAKMPVICSDATVLPEIAQGGALYFEPDSEVQLAEQMLRLLNEPALRLKLQDLGTDVLKQYDPMKMAQGFRDTYAEMCGAI